MWVSHYGNLHSGKCVTVTCVVYFNYQHIVNILSYFLLVIFIPASIRFVGFYFAIYVSKKVLRFQCTSLYYVSLIS